MNEKFSLYHSIYYKMTSVYLLLLITCHSTANMRPFENNWSIISICVTSFLVSPYVLLCFVSFFLISLLLTHLLMHMPIILHLHPFIIHYSSTLSPLHKCH